MVSDCEELQRMDNDYFEGRKPDAPAEPLCIRVDFGELFEQLADSVVFERLDLLQLVELLVFVLQNGLEIQFWRGQIDLLLCYGLLRQTASSRRS